MSPMSILKQSGDSLRIIALPLTRKPPNLSLPGATPLKELVYYHFQINVPRPLPPPARSSQTSSFLPEEGVVKWAQNKASGIWSGFGKAPEGNWKSKTFRYGERLIDRIDFEELALKSVDPSLGPTLNYPGKTVAEKSDRELLIPLIYPASVCSASSVLNNMRSLLNDRTPKHRKGFYTWMTIAPFTAPFMLIPVIPNLPFFFCVWRSWSHYRAYRASQYLESLLENGTIVPKDSPELDELYKTYNVTTPPSPPPTNATLPQEKSSSQPEQPGTQSYNQTRTDSSDSTSLLITREAVPDILTTFDLPASAGTDVLRALEQSHIRT